MEREACIPNRLARLCDRHAAWLPRQVVNKQLPRGRRGLRHLSRWSLPSGKTDPTGRRIGGRTG
jgi:hypothetical protein